MTLKELIDREKDQSREDGLAEGLAAGASSMQEKIALKMLEENLALDLIAKTTDLTLEEIEELKHK